jgi:hypothetical protein
MEPRAIEDIDRMSLLTRTRGDRQKFAIPVLENRKHAIGRQPILFTIGGEAAAFNPHGSRRFRSRPDIAGLIFG